MSTNEPTPNAAAGTEAGTNATIAGEAPPLLDIAGLTVRFPRAYGPEVAVLDRIDLRIGAGECVGLVGESGSGKSLLGLSIVGLAPRGAELSGTIALRGDDVLAMGERELRRRRGPDVAMIYQDALTSLDPAFTIGNALREVCRRGSAYTPLELLDLVALGGGDRILDSYPHELSGGQRQRVLIALALSRDPALVVADEPTTALDVTVQAQVVALLRRLQAEVGFSMLLISHDLGLVAQLASRIAVMYAGQLVELRRADSVLRGPRHPYTRGLLDARLSLEQRDETLRVIAGTVPSPRAFSSGCRFRDRCERAQDDCAVARPERRADGDGLLACYHPIPEEDRS
jgi:oligopeptide/dipeptide ABC transporter ATP-binding protein